MNTAFRSPYIVTSFSVFALSLRAFDPAYPTDCGTVAPCVLSPRVSWIMTPCISGGVDGTNGRRRGGGENAVPCVLVCRAAARIVAIAIGRRGDKIESMQKERRSDGVRCSGCTALIGTSAKGCIVECTQAKRNLGRLIDDHRLSALGGWVLLLHCVPACVRSVVGRPMADDGEPAILWSVRSRISHFRLIHRPPAANRVILTSQSKGATTDLHIYKCRARESVEVRIASVRQYSIFCLTSYIPHTLSKRPADASSKQLCLAYPNRSRHRSAPLRH